jgi:hypothetical protein
MDVLLTRSLAGLMRVQALLGLIFSGQYRDPEPIHSSWFGNDWVTLVLAVPLLLAGFVRAARGAARGLMVWLGMIAYAVFVTVQGAVQLEAIGVPSDE